MNKYLAILATVIFTSSLGNTTTQAEHYNPIFSNESITVSTAVKNPTFISLSGTAIKCEPIVSPSGTAIRSQPSASPSTLQTSVSTGTLQNIKKKKQKYKKMEVPKHNNFKSYMGYQSITCKASKQYKLQQKAKTGKYGIRTVKGRYLIAMGTYYTKNVGDKFDIKLSDGTILKCMIGDIKSDRHTDTKRQKQKYDGSIIEFISDPAKMPANVKRAGSYTACKKFSGSIKEIRKLK